MKRMMYLVVISIVLTTVPNLLHAEETKISPELEKILRDSSRFQEVYGTTNLPKPVVALCADSKGKLAEPGKKWNGGCNITEDSPPGSRLIWAVTDGVYYVVHFECGGEAVTHPILVAILQPNTKAITVWKGFALYQIKDYEAFLRELETGRIVQGH